MTDLRRVPDPVAPPTVAPPKPADIGRPPADLSLADLKRIRAWASVASSPQYRWTAADKQLLARVEQAIRQAWDDENPVETYA